MQLVFLDGAVVCTITRPRKPKQQKVAAREQARDEESQRLARSGQSQSLSLPIYLGRKTAPKDKGKDTQIR